MSLAGEGTVIIGAGPAGTAAAITLAGTAPLLIERSRIVGEKVCGEFLGTDAVAILATLGVDLPALGAVPVRRAMIAAGRRHADFALPFQAWSLPRAVLDAALQDRAAASGTRLRLGVGVAAAEPEGRGWRLRLANGGSLAAERVILATGKHELRGVARGVPGGALGLKVPLAGVDMGDSIALLAFAGGYAGLQPRAGGGANLCLAIDPAAPGAAEAARDPAMLLALVSGGSALGRDLLRDSVPAWTRPMAIAGIPYGFVARGGAPTGLFRVGDQAAVVASLCGDGIAMALASGQHAARAVLAGQAAAAHQAGWADAVSPGMRVARLLDGAMGRWPGPLVVATGWLPSVARWAARRTRLGAALDAAPRGGA